MSFAYSESAQVVRGALGAVLRGRREAARRTLSEVAAEAGLSPAHLSEVERGRKEVSTERLLAVAPASLPLEALRSVADFSAYMAMANPPPKPRPRIGFDTRR